MQRLLDGFNSWLETVNEGRSELENRSIKVQILITEKTLKSSNKHILDDLWENIKQLNIYIFSLKRREKDGQEKEFEHQSGCPRSLVNPEKDEDKGNFT